MEPDQDKMSEKSSELPVSGAFQRLLGDASAYSGRGPAPVHLWNPPYCGEIDMRIASDGRWYYNGSEIRRIALVRLFSTILRKDPDRFVLVNPVERVGITVDDAPFLAVALETEPSASGDRLLIRTNVDDIVEVSREHPIRFETARDGGLKPYIHIRGDLWALASRALTHELVARSALETLEKSDIFGMPGEHSREHSRADSGDIREIFGLRSGETCFFIANAADMESF